MNEAVCEIGQPQLFKLDVKVEYFSDLFMRWTGKRKFRFSRI